MEEAVTALLLGDAVVKQIAGTKIHWFRAPQPTKPPYVVLQVVSGTDDITNDGLSGLAQARVQIDTYGATFDETKRLSAAVFKVLAGRRTELKGTRIKGGFPDTIRDLPASDAGEVNHLFRRSRDIIIWHSPSHKEAKHGRYTASIGYGITFEMADAASMADAVYIAEITDVTPPSEETDQVEATHMQSPNKTREYIAGMTDPGEASFEMNLVPGSESDKELTTAKGKRKRCRITFPNGVQVLFWGSRQTYEKNAPTDDKMTATASFKVSGEPVMTDPTAPRNLDAPTISGTAKVGLPLEVDPGVWAGVETLSFQWKAAAANIAGATGTSYVPKTADIGDPITCQVTGANGSFSTGVTTAATANVVA